MTKLAVSVAALAIASLLPVAAAQPAQAAPVKNPLNISNVKTVQTSATRVKTSAKITLKVRKTGTYKRVGVTLNPAGTVKKTGKTTKKSVRVKWSAKSKVYVGSVNFTTRAPGKITATYKAGKTAYKRSVTTKKATTKLSGVTTKGVTVKAGATVKNKIKVSGSAHGRKVIVQLKSGAKWKAYKTYTLAKTKKTQSVTIAVKAPTAGNSRTYRIYVPATITAAKSKVYTRTIKASPVRVENPTPKPDAPKQQPTPTPNPTPTPKPETPNPTPVLDCGDDLFGNKLDCYTIKTFANALDHVPTVNLNCGITRTCERVASPAELEAIPELSADEAFAVMEANAPKKAVYPIAVPKMLDQINNYRATKNLPPVHPLPALATAKTNGIVSPGQGSIAQDWARHMAYQGSISHGSGWSDLTAYVNTQYPDARGFIWSCGEVVAASGGTASSQIAVTSWIRSNGHRSHLEAPSLFGIIGAAADSSGRISYSYQGCTLYDESVIGPYIPASEYIPAN